MKLKKYKLVELTELGYSAEIDRVKLVRVAAEFKDWLLSLSNSDNIFNLVEDNLNIINDAMNGTLELPYKGIRPLLKEWREGLIRPDYWVASVPFYYLISGLNIVKSGGPLGSFDGLKTAISMNGKSYGFAEFEAF
jgi:hypothetical protein